MADDVTAADGVCHCGARASGWAASVAGWPKGIPATFDAFAQRTFLASTFGCYDAPVNRSGSVVIPARHRDRILTDTFRALFLAASHDDATGRVVAATGAGGPGRGAPGPPLPGEKGAPRL